MPLTGRPGERATGPPPVQWQDAAPRLQAAYRTSSRDTRLHSLSVLPLHDEVLALT